MNNVLTPEYMEDLGFNVYRYDYSQADTIFYRQVNPEVTAKVLDYCNRNRASSSDESVEITRSKLAGDIRQEYTLAYDEEIYGLIKQTVKHSLSALLQVEVIDLFMESPWVNYQKQYECNPKHQHAGNYSLVWYLDIPEIIREEHLHQKGKSQSRGLIEFSSMYVGNQNLLFNPKTSDMFIFKAQHEHQVYPFYSDVERVSLSTNIFNISMNHPEEGIVNL
jgi:hypothetical protein